MIERLAFHGVIYSMLHSYSVFYVTLVLLAFIKLYQT